MAKALLLIFLGGGLGSVFRFGIHRAVGSIHTGYFPYGTLLVNILACMIVGGVVGMADHRQMLGADARLFWTIGFCGGFSTFSTFSMETIAMLQGEFTLAALMYVLASVTLCLAATFAGLYASQHF